MIFYTKHYLIKLPLSIDYLGVLYSQTQAPTEKPRSVKKFEDPLLGFGEVIDLSPLFM